MTEYIKSLNLSYVVEDIRSLPINLSYVVEILGYSWISTNKYIYGIIFMEKLEKTLKIYESEFISKDMSSILLQGPLLFYINQTLIILKDLHTKNIFHADNHLSNFMIDSNKNVKIIDFGLLLTTNLEELKSIAKRLGLKFYIQDRLILLLELLLIRVKNNNLKSKIIDFNECKKKDYQKLIDKHIKIIKCVLGKYDYWILAMSMNFEQFIKFKGEILESMKSDKNCQSDDKNDNNNILINELVFDMLRYNYKIFDINETNQKKINQRKIALKLFFFEFKSILQHDKFEKLFSRYI
jgi:serine/threonine protein kinase